MKIKICRLSFILSAIVSFFSISMGSSVQKVKLDNSVDVISSYLAKNDVKETVLENSGWTEATT